MASSSSSSPPSMAYDNRFSYITPDDHGAWLWVVSLLALIYALLVLVVRLAFVKRKIYSLDDTVIILAHFVGIGMWVSIFASLDNGLGKSLKLLNDVEISQMQKSFFASRILLYIALTLSKFSILMLIRGVFNREPKVSRMVYGTMAVVAVWGLIGILGDCVGCSPDAIISQSGGEQCVGSVPWLRAVAIGDVLTELAIILLPMIGFYHSLMPIKRRIAVFLAFATRSPNIVFALMHLFAYSKFINDRQPATSVDATVAWQNVLLSYSLMSATIPTLKGFTQGFMTAGFSLGYISDTSMSGTQRSGTHGTQKGHELRSLPRSRPKSEVSPQEIRKNTDTAVGAKPAEQGLQRKPARTKSASKDETLCFHDESASIGSHDSQQIMIKREWKVSSH